MKLKLAIIFMVYGGLLLVWFICVGKGEGPFWMPSLEKVFVRGFSSTLWAHAFSTFKTMSYAAFLALAFSLPLGWVLSKSPWLRMIVQSFLLIFQILPMFVLAPLMIFWFGWTRVAVVVPTALMMVFPLVLHSIRGFTATPIEYCQFFQVHGATKRQLFFKLKLPYALPYLFSGLRICVSFAGVGAIAGEFAGAQEGIGVFLQECRRAFDLEGLFAGIFCLLFLTLTMYFFFYGMERIFCKEVKADAL